MREAYTYSDRESVVLESNNNKYKSLIAISLFFAPYTALRVFQIGISEFMILILFGLALFSRRVRLILNLRDRFIFTRFWLYFLFFSFLGFAYNYFFMAFPSGDLSSTLFDLAAYLFVFMCCLSLESLFGKGPIKLDFEGLFKSVFVFSSTVLLFFFIISSRIHGSIFGFSLNYFGAFRPFATNIHHVSMFVAPLPFLGLKCILNSKHWYSKVILFGLVISSIIIGINTRSAKIILAFYMGFFAFLISEILLNRHLKSVRRVLLLILVVQGLLLGMFFWDNIYSQVLSFFGEVDLSGARYVIYTGSLEKSLNSPIVGYGPGAHAVGIGGYFVDAHQTFLTALLQAGILGVIIYGVLMIRILTKCINDPFILGAYFSILLYSIGGDIMRRLPMWLFLVLFYYYCLQKDENRITRRKYSYRGGKA